MEQESEFRPGDLVRPNNERCCCWPMYKDGRVEQEDKFVLATTDLDQSYVVIATRPSRYVTLLAAAYWEEPQTPSPVGAAGSGGFSARVRSIGMVRCMAKDLILTKRAQSVAER